MPAGVIRTADALMTEIDAAVPRYLPRDPRDDAIQSIWLAVLERRLPREEISACAHEFVRGEYKANHNASGLRSLNVPTRIDSNTTLLDTLASGSSGLRD